MRMLLLLCIGACANQGPNTDWRIAGGDPGNTRFSTLDQINATNVARLKVA
jgi:glucose dehydrogenase